MRSHTLLERLAQPQKTENPDGDTDRLRLSILANLRRVLSTRQGHAPAQPDLGTPSPSEIIQDHPACIARLQHTVGLCIQRYEPRLANVRVRHAASDLADCTLRFQIYAELADGLRTAVTFTTHVNALGRLECAP